MNRFAFRCCARNLPFSYFDEALSAGLPGRLKSIVTPRTKAQRSSSELVLENRTGRQGVFRWVTEEYEKTTRRRFTSELKARVALEALRGDKTVQEIASQYKVQPNQVSTWK